MSGGGETCEAVALSSGTTKALRACQVNQMHLPKRRPSFQQIRAGGVNGQDTVAPAARAVHESRARRPVTHACKLEAQVLKYLS